MNHGSEKMKKDRNKETEGRGNTREAFVNSNRLIVVCLDIEKACNLILETEMLKTLKISKVEIPQLLAIPKVETNIRIQCQS